MTKLRNIDYLRFGSKIRQGFASGITSITPPLSPSPLSGSRGQEMRVRGKGLSFYIGGEPAAPPPGGRCLPPGKGAAGSRQGPPRKKNYVYLHVSPCRPLRGGRGIKL